MALTFLSDPYAKEMQEEYSAYIHAHRDFAEYQARKWMVKIGAIDFSNIEAFTYTALNDLISHMQPEQSTIRDYIANEIQKVQGELQSLSNSNLNKIKNNIDATAKYLDDICQVAEDILTLFNRLPTHPTQGEYIRVQDVAENIKNQEQKLKQSAIQLANSGQITISYVLPEDEIKKNKGQKLKNSTVKLDNLYQTLISNTASIIAKPYEYLLSAWLGQVPEKAEQITALNLGAALAGSKSELQSPRWGQIIKLSTSFSIPEETRRITVDKNKNRRDDLIGQGGSNKLIDWYMDEEGIGFAIKLAISQKEYWPNKTITTMELSGLTTTIGGKIREVAGDSHQAYALWRAFACPSSRETAHGETQRLADALLRHTIFNDIFGSGNDSVSAMLINRVFYSSEAIVQFLTNAPKSWEYRKSQLYRFNINLGNEGTGASSTAPPEVVEARQTELGAAGVWLSRARLSQIQKASFVSHWRFDTAWFAGKIKEYL